jgi:hypothetical protein
MILTINGLALALGEDEGLLSDRVASLLGLPGGAVQDLRIIRRSVDARRARPPCFVNLLQVRVPDDTSVTPLPGHAGLTIKRVDDDDPGDTRPAPSRVPVARPTRRPVVAGCGPAGLFAALTLAEKGLPVLLLERGRAVPERIADVRAFWETGRLDPESHVHFGEGGAGTFSDGKLTSRVKNPYTAWVKRVLADLGAPADILVNARPHIGTDRLRAVVMNLRQRLIGLGCEIRFGTAVTDLRVRGGSLAGVTVNSCEEIDADCLILATGQSADDTYRMLARRGVALTPKPFAIGLRVEHPQETINRIQYGRWAGHPSLPPADYFLTARVAPGDRAVYSFCMCPGGQVIGCSAEPGGVITNGMSQFDRDSLYANSAVVVSVGSGDFGADGPLAGLGFRRRIEEEAFRAGGGGYHAPAQRLTSFLSGRPGPPPLPCSFRPGVQEADLGEVLPLFAAAALRRGFRVFERKMPGFVTEEATLIGVETRTSSPVRILRGGDGQSATLAGLFPCGEGAGYAGGIVSSALDGIRAAEQLAGSLAWGTHRGSGRRRSGTPSGTQSAGHPPSDRRRDRR